jgi:cytochrome c-type biogenesis protein CcmE
MMITDRSLHPDAFRGERAVVVTGDLEIKRMVEQAERPFGRRRLCLVLALM